MEVTQIITMHRKPGGRLAFMEGLVLECQSTLKREDTQKTTFFIMATELFVFSIVKDAHSN